MASFDDIDIIDSFLSDDKEDNDFVYENIIISFDGQKEHISFSTFKLDDFYFRPLKENISTLLFCAFFANYFDFFYSYSYFMSINIRDLKAYDEDSIGNKENFSFKNQNFRSFTPLLYYKNECLLDINNFIQISPSGSNNKSIQDNLIENETKDEMNNLLLNELIELVECMGAFICHEVIFIESENQIIDTIENDYHTDFNARTYIFRSNIDMPYQVTVELNIKNIPEIKTKFIFRICWCIFEDKLIYIDEDENSYEFNLKTYSFINKGENKYNKFQNSIYTCYSLQCK